MITKPNQPIRFANKLSKANANDEPITLSAKANTVIVDLKVRNTSFVRQQKHLSDFISNSSPLILLLFAETLIRIEQQDKLRRNSTTKIRWREIVERKFTAGPTVEDGGNITSPSFSEMK